MHLWPSLRIRDSFKTNYLKKLEWNLHRMKSEKDSQNNQNLLSNSESAKREAENSDSKTSGVLIIVKELLMLLSCCYCCFCCGACGDEEENI
ncbi:hypothetical protein AQUCO_03000167v1 [Aquilegia coerulea]|uniref:Uncharacterized protein n=1 Tax=Aquilegia coerulea TaxID=218851 RepID=A0A2G5D2G5_AQUCA|nr:hypothetical protein AQUCO_03000167v1 [Aquilegia coerulea]